jgi:hypothetical protein
MACVVWVELIRRQERCARSVEDGQNVDRLCSLLDADAVDEVVET